MLFSSSTFFVFFAIYFILHVVTPPRYRLYLIICGSTVFYSWWKLQYLWLPYLLMATAYIGVVWMARATNERSRKRRAAAAIVALFLPLVFFKYTDFVYRSVISPFSGEDDVLIGVPLPLGVSFVTFTLTAYVVDIYRGKFPAGTSTRTVLAYVLFFPHLIAGPILRPDELMPQLEAPTVGWLKPTTAIAIFTVGLVKKLVFADQIAELVDAVYNRSGIPSAPEALCAIYGFSVQIYCDFSGYTDMAIGLAMLLGIRLPENFARPYCTASIVDFWRRWHITLSFWLRDYLYIPLGGSHRGRSREMRNIILTMALGGLWHGANWTFVIWGVLHGVAVAFVHGIRRRVRSETHRMPRGLGTLLTFHFVTLSWVLFRAPSLRRAAEMISGLFVREWSHFQTILTANSFPVLLMVVFFLAHPFDDHAHVGFAVQRLRQEMVWPGIALLWIVAITVSQGSSGRFIYFDF